MAYNIQQANTATVKGAPQVDAPISFTIPGDNSEIPKYVVAVSDKEILKLGYCCEEKGHIYPIFLEMNGKYEIIRLWKNGIYEMQPEQFTNANDSDAEEETTDVIVTGVMVPAGIDFVLDYVTSVI
jgi:hypothetical protein